MKRNMRRMFLMYMVLSCLLFTACARAVNVPVKTEEMICFTDDLGYEIQMESPKRVASLLGSFAQVWMLAGGQICAAPDDAWEDLHLELPENAVNLGNTKNLSLEQLLGSQPDFILASTNTRQNMEWQEVLKGTSIPVAYFDMDDFEDYLRILEICTDITGRRDLYEEYGIRVREQIEAVLEQKDKRLETKEAPRVLSMTASASMIRAKNSEGNVLGAMLNDLDCINIADSDKGLLEDVNIEHILMSDPDYIFFVQRGDDEEGMKQFVEQYFTEHPAWNQLRAVQEGRVYFMDKKLFHLKPNHRWGEAYEILENILEQE